MKYVMIIEIIKMILLAFTPFQPRDFTSYMQQAEHLIHGERDYSKIGGEAGPLVYPALHSYLYMVLANSWVSNYGEYKLFPILLSFIAEILITYFSVKLYQIGFEENPKLSNMVFLAIFSFAPVSIAIDHLFNDVYSSLFQTMAIYSFATGKSFLGVLLVSVALSFKLGPILLIPAVYLVTSKSHGIFIGTLYILMIGAFQIVFSLPFAIHYPREYFTAAYNIGRKFGNNAILNYKLLPLEVL
jgi:alpha-1,3-mannosyltransferase